MGILNWIFGDFPWQSEAKMHLADKMVEQGICLTCGGDGKVAYGSVDILFCPACNGTGKITNKEES